MIRFQGMEINVATMVLMAKFAIPAMVKNDIDTAGGCVRGSIVNLGSVAGLRGGEYEQCVAGVELMFE